MNGELIILIGGSIIIRTIYLIWVSIIISTIFIMMCIQRYENEERKKWYL